MGQRVRSNLRELICRKSLIKRAVPLVFLATIPAISVAETFFGPYEPQVTPTDASFSVSGIIKLNRDETSKQIADVLEQPQQASETKL